MLKYMSPTINYSRDITMTIKFSRIKKISEILNINFFLKAKHKTMLLMTTMKYHAKLRALWAFSSFSNKEMKNTNQAIKQKQLYDY